MSYAAVVDTSTLVALVRGGVWVQLGQVFQPIFIGSDAGRECQNDASAVAALSQTQSRTPAFPITLNLIARSRMYHPQLSPADIQGMEIALARSAVLITQDAPQRVEAISAGVGVIDTFDVLFGFKQLGLIVRVRSVLDEMERNGEHYTKSQKNHKSHAVGCGVHNLLGFRCVPPQQVGGSNCNRVTFESTTQQSERAVNPLAEACILCWRRKRKVTL